MVDLVLGRSVPNETLPVLLGVGGYHCYARQYIGLGPLLVKLAGERGEIKAQSTDFIIYENDIAICVLPETLFNLLRTDAHVPTHASVGMGKAPKAGLHAGLPGSKDEDEEEKARKAAASHPPHSGVGAASQQHWYDEKGKIDPNGKYDATGHKLR